MRRVDVSPGDVTAEVRRMLGGLSLIGEVHELLCEPGEPRIFNLTPDAAATETFAPCTVPNAGGVGFSRGQALHTMVGECVERYSASYYDPAELVYASGDELAGRADGRPVGMDEFSAYSPAQYDHPSFPLPRYASHQPIYWATGRALGSGQVRWVPATMVYLGYRGDAGDMFSLPVSTGTACHTDPDRAVLTALFEVVERDAFMITWLCRLTRTRVRFAADPHLRTLYHEHLSGTGLRYHVFDITSDFAIPTMLCLIEARSARGPTFAAGAAARLTERDAIAKAMLEAASAIAYSRSVYRRTPDWKPEPGFTNVYTFEDHVRLYAEPNMRRHLAFLLDTPRERDPRTDGDIESFGAPADVQECAARIARRGYEPIVCDVTAPDVAFAGFVCPRVLIPGAVPLVATHGLTAVGSPRLVDVPRQLGYAVPGRLNRIPHPFA